MNHPLESTLLHELIERSAARAPDSLALSYRGQHLSYAQLWAQVQGFAHGLLAQGLAARRACRHLS